MRKVILSNGMSVVFAGNASKYSVCASVNVGHVNEPKLGIAKVAENVLLSKLKGVLLVAGGTMTAYTSSGRDIDEVLAKLSGLFSEVLITEEDVAAAQELICNQTMSLEKVSWRHAKNNYRLCAFGADSVKPTSVYLEAIKSYSVEDVRDFLSTYYTASNIVLVIAGPREDYSELQQVVVKYFGGVKKGVALPRMMDNIYTGGAGFIDTEDNMTRLMFGWDLYGLSVDDGPVCNVLMSMLLGRLERAYADSGYPDVSVELKVAGYYGLRTMRVMVVSHEVDAKALTDIFVKVINRICDTCADDYRMERSRNAAMVEKLNKYNSSDDYALEVGWQMVGRGQMYGVSDRINSISETTAGDVRDLASRIMRGSRLTYIVAQKKEKERYGYAAVMHAIGLSHLLKDEE